MRPDFQEALKVVLEHEVGSKWQTGGYVNHPNDPGGPTKYGISLRWLEDQGIDIDGDGDVDIDDILALDVDSASTLYHEHFWLPPYDTIDDHYVATKVFDMAVNMGHERAHKLVQQACNKLGSNLIADSDLGPLSVHAINSYEPGQMLKSIIEEQSQFYQNLAARKPKMAVFLRGWLARASWPWTERTNWP